MPHDIDGKRLEKGDLVTVTCRVYDVYQTEGEGYCNVTLETVEPMYPTDRPSTFTLNTRQVKRLFPVEG